MANEISTTHSQIGRTLYAVIRSTARTYWNGSAFETLTVANWGNYDIALTETPANSYFYIGTWPSGVSTEDWYWVDVFEQAGSAVSSADQRVNSILGYWDGAEFNPSDQGSSTATPGTTYSFAAPATIGALASQPLKANRYCSFSWSIPFASTQASGTLKFCATSLADKTTILWSLDSTHFTIAGDGLSAVVADTDANMTTPGTLFWFIQNLTTDRRAAEGTLEIEDGPNVTA